MERERQWLIELYLINNSNICLFQLPILFFFVYFITYYFFFSFVQSDMVFFLVLWPIPMHTEQWHIFFLSLNDGITRRVKIYKTKQSHPHALEKWQPLQIRIQYSNEGIKCIYALRCFTNKNFQTKEEAEGGGGGEERTQKKQKYYVHVCSGKEARVAIRRRPRSVCNRCAHPKICIRYSFSFQFLFRIRSMYCSK